MEVMEMKKIIIGILILVLIVSFSGCFEQTPEAKEKITSKEEASKTTVEISEDLDGLSGSLKELDDELG